MQPSSPPSGYLSDDAHCSAQRLLIFAISVSSPAITGPMLKPQQCAKHPSFETNQSPCSHQRPRCLPLTVTRTWMHKFPKISRPNSRRDKDAWISQIPREGADTFFGNDARRISLLEPIPVESLHIDTVLLLRNAAGTRQGFPFRNRHRSHSCIIRTFVPVILQDKVRDLSYDEGRSKLWPTTRKLIEPCTRTVGAQRRQRAVAMTRE